MKVGESDKGIDSWNPGKVKFVVDHSETTPLFTVVLGVVSLNEDRTERHEVD